VIQKSLRQAFFTAFVPAHKFRTQIPHTKSRTHIPHIDMTSSLPPRPLPQDVSDYSYRYTLVQRIHCLVLATEGYSATEIERKTGISQRSQQAIRKKAYDRGFRPEEDPRILESYVIDGKRSGRPKEILEDTEKALLASVREDRSGREKSSEVLAYEQGISQSSALRILHSNRLTNVKPTTKPGLTPAMRKIRLEWCLDHQHWTGEDWKNVIWSDETSVVLGHRRGAVRVWRASNEAYDSTVI
jgi:hypothetical protein